MRCDARVWATGPPRHPAPYRFRRPGEGAATRRLPASGILGLALGLPASARGDGRPAGPLVGGAGATAPGGTLAYVTVRAGNRTLLEETERFGHTVIRAALLRPGDLYVTRAAFAGDGTGLSADGRTLVLARFGSAYPPRRSAFAVVDAATCVHALRGQPLVRPRARRAPAVKPHSAGGGGPGWALLLIAAPALLAGIGLMAARRRAARPVAAAVD